MRFGLDVPTFATRRLHACHHARAPSGGRWNCGREMSGKLCLNAHLRVIFRDLLHAVKLRHGTDSFTSPPKEGVLRIFFALKIRRLRPGANPRTWVPKASTLPLNDRSRLYNEILRVSIQTGHFRTTRGELKTRILLAARCMEMSGVTGCELRVTAEHK